MNEYLIAWKYLEQRSLWPTHNHGINEQPALFLEVIDIMDTIKNYIDNRNDEKREKMRSLNGNKGN